VNRESTISLAQAVLGRNVFCEWCQSYLEMSPSLTRLKCPLFIVYVVVGMRTEATPC